MKKIAVIGAHGMLGSEIISYLSSFFSVVGISKENYQTFIGKKFDVVINANGNSKRYWANQHVLEDFDLSTTSVYKSIFNFPCVLYIYISSSDIYENHENVETTDENQSSNISKLSPYGLHKYLSEKIVINAVSQFIILRCSMMLGKRLKKGPIYDAIHDRDLFVTPDSYLQMITAQEVAQVIYFFINSDIKNEVYNIGGSGTIRMSDLKKYFKKSIRFSSSAEKQKYEINIKKISKVYSLKTSQEYLSEFFESLNI